VSSSWCHPPGLIAYKCAAMHDGYRFPAGSVSGYRGRASFTKDPQSMPADKSAAIEGWRARANKSWDSLNRLRSWADGVGARLVKSVGSQ